MTIIETVHFLSIKHITPNAINNPSPKTLTKLGMSFSRSKPISVLTLL